MFLLCILMIVVPFFITYLYFCIYRLIHQLILI